jgi:hypothetical protein
MHDHGEVTLRVRASEQKTTLTRSIDFPGSSRYNSIHDVTQPPVLFANPKDRRVQVISLLFSDAQTHYADYIGNLMFEANACTYLPTPPMMITYTSSVSVANRSILNTMIHLTRILPIYHKFQSVRIGHWDMTEDIHYVT